MSTLSTTFTINGMFNKLPVRIIGTPSNPFLYAVDLCDCLGIANTSRAVSHLDPEGIVTQEQRKQYNLTTYRVNKSTAHVDNTMILLNKHGAYQLIYNSKSPVGHSFRVYVTELIENARFKEQEQLIVRTNEQIKAMTLQLAQKDAELAQKNEIINDINKYNPIIYVFSKDIDDDNAYSHILLKDREPVLTQRSSVNTHAYSQHGILYKYTTAPTPEDYSGLTFVGRVFGDTDTIMRTLQWDGLSISSRAARTSIYSVWPLPKEYYFVEK
jgi:prophage antirepressor-like protein